MGPGFLERLLGGGETQHRHLVRGVAAGFVLALGKQSRNPLLNKAAGLYIWFFRSLPLLVLLVFIYNLPQVFPRRARCCPILSTPGSRRWC